MIAKYWILNIEVAILLRSTLADKVRFLRAASFEGVTDHHQNTLWTFTKKNGDDNKQCFDDFGQNVSK